MKLDIKMIIIIVLALALVGFIMFGNKGGVNHESYEKERKVLQEQIDSLESLKSQSDARIDSLEESYSQILEDFKKLEMVNDSLTAEIEELTVEIESRKQDYYESQEKIKKLNEKLKEKRQNPPNREGDELINNLRNTFN